MDFEHGGNIIQMSRNLGVEESELLDFSVNINPLGFPENFKKVIIDNINKLSFYPEIYSQSLKEEISAQLSISSDNIAVGNGSTQLIYCLPEVLKLKKAVVVEPTFSEYKKALIRYNCKVETFMLNEVDNFIIDVELLINFLQQREFDALFLCNPNNPNGYLVKTDELKKLSEFMEKSRKFLIIDEAFIDFTGERSFSSFQYNYIVILKSLTKIFAIPGLRLGYLKANRTIIESIEKILEPWSVNIFSQLIGIETLKQDKFIENTKKFLEKERDFVVKELSKIKGIKIFPSYTNYLLIKILTSVNVNQLEKYLLCKKILIRNCSNFYGLDEKFFRISINDRNSNIKLIKELKEFFQINLAGKGENEGTFQR